MIAQKDTGEHHQSTKDSFDRDRKNIEKICASRDGGLVDVFLMFLPINPIHELLTYVQLFLIPSENCPSILVSLIKTNLN